MATSSAYRRNHYVPEWYQKRFMLAGQSQYHYLDLWPEVVVREGHKYTRRALRQLGAGSCFAQDDLYTVKWGNVENTEIERFFFGKIDGEGQGAIEYFANFQHPSVDGKAFRNLLTYMTMQKLRTPKGLGWLSAMSRITHQALTLITLQELHNLFDAMWTECVWQIADASASSVKLIISDHPVTVYNRGCLPGSDYCIGFNDPDIRYAATHTYFPLSLEKVLILTNLSWVRNPYQRETTPRPNPNYFRSSMFKFTDIQVFRSLSEEEVLQINYITKRRAYRYVAAAEREWLYPEKHLTSTNWAKLGNGLLLMPEPREIHMGGEILIGYKDGSHDAFSEYGHKPWQKGYKDEERARIEGRALERFKAEWSVAQGPAYRGTAYNFRREGPYVTPPEFHEHYLARAKQFRDVERKRKGTHARH
jgi:hypothetical protein